jgi:hypothetical protein
LLPKPPPFAPLSCAYAQPIWPSQNWQKKKNPFAPLSCAYAQPIWPSQNWQKKKKKKKKEKKNPSLREELEKLLY